MHIPKARFRGGFIVLVVASALIGGVDPGAHADRGAGTREGREEQARRREADHWTAQRVVPAPRIGLSLARPVERPSAWRLQQPLAAPTMHFDPAAPVVDASAEAASAAPLAGDLDPTIDVQINQEILDKAAVLATPEAMYRFVRDEIEFQPYYGSLKGSVETLRQRAGNDYDQASLLIALLRASGIPARYAEGMVEMPTARATSWLAVNDGEVASSILYTNGMEGVAVVAPGGGTNCCVGHGTPGCDDAGIQACVCAQDSFCCTTQWDSVCAGEVESFGCGVCVQNVVAVRARRVWVEAFVPRDFGGKAWVPLDPAFGLTEVQQGRDIPEEMGLDEQAFIDDYIDPAAPGVTLPRPETVIELLKQQLQLYLDANHPGETVEAAKRAHKIVPDDLSVLPASLPYTVRSRDGFFSEIPVSRRYRVRFHLHNGGTTFIDHTVDLPTVASRRITISYEGATVGDQATIAAYHGVLYTPPNLISLRPKLKVGGQTVASGSGSIGAGRSHQSDMYFLAPVNGQGLPQNVVPAIFNTIVAGEFQAVGLAVHGTTSPLIVPEDPSDTEGYVAHQRHADAMDYLRRGLEGDAELAAIYHARLAYDVDDAIVKDDILVFTDIFGNPVSWEWRGLTVDADRSVLGVWDVNQYQSGCGGEGQAVLTIGGAEGSLFENRIFEDDYAQEAVSTMKILQLAVDQGITVYKHWSTLPLPANTLSSSVRSAIQNAIAAGHVVTFPAAELAHFQWTGTGYIDMNPCDGAAGYIISGGQNGGSTVDSWVDILWADPTRTVAYVEGQVDSPPQDAPHVQAIFHKADTTPLKFDYQLRIHYTDGSTGPWAVRNHTSKSPSQLQPDHYVLIVGDQGPQHKRKLTVYEIKLKEVSFLDTNHTIKKDDGSLDYTAPHWTDVDLNGTADPAAGEHKYPVAFTRNTKMALQAKFRVVPSPDPAIQFKVRADGAGSLDIPLTAGSVSGDTLTLPKTPASGAFSNNVQKNTPLVLAFEVSLDNGGHWYLSGKSDNPCYVTLGKPVGTPVYHTLLHIGCERGDGNTDAPSTIADVWSEFTDRDVRRVDGTQMSYYASWTCTTTTTAGLLSTSDGQCGSWAKLLIDTLKVQGVDQSGDYVLLESSAASGADGFLVKNWGYAGGGGISGVAGFPYLNLQKSPLIQGNTYAWKFAEASDQAGIAGQATANPASLFNNHQIVKIGGTYYDPSYGATFANLTAIDSGSIAGYFRVGTLAVNEPAVNVDLNGDGDKVDLGVVVPAFIVKQNPAGLDLKETIYDY